ncbi:glycosyltransferase [Pedobacter chinensis]|uniref:Glycosyltransferase n=1 Tax=Pedobacter chinensis TaxID=2282421 RepID=A0A369PZM8_9SPHI|nr:glycosyltransferase [Pedobacter chinensis]RDC56216.1 glycosyltransferase [Pedobacter chinensis]
MKVCLVSEYFYPHGKGGTEKYVYQLAKELMRQDNEVCVITVSEEENSDYFYKGIIVKTVLIESNYSKAIISGRQGSPNIKRFENILIYEKPEIVHFHTLTPSFNFFHFEIAKSLSSTIYFTAHIPGITCIHGDLMLFGKKACDGKIIEHRCLACYINKKKIHKEMASLMASLILQANYPTALANVVKQKQKDVIRLNELCDVIYIFTEWQKEIFIKNGIDLSKLVMTQQMEVVDPKSQSIKSTPKEPGKIKLGFIGRISHEKGLHILINAFKAVNNPNLELHIAGIIADKQDSYFQQLITKKHSNIYWNYNLSQQEVEAFYDTIDVICIPSIWYETGPFVLYEAFKKHLPVIANDLGDMRIWANKGYDLRLYQDKKELIDMLSQY